MCLAEGFNHNWGLDLELRNKPTCVGIGSWRFVQGSWEVLGRLFGVPWQLFWALGESLGMLWGGSEVSATELKGFGIPNGAGVLPICQHNGLSEVSQRSQSWHKGHTT